MAGFPENSVTPERYQQIKAIFDALEEAPDSDRPALLADLCAGDRSLLDAVERLRDAAQRSDTLLSPDTPYSASKLLETFDCQELEGRKIGNYTVVREIGRGGMGRVYLALRSEDFQKRVAIKFLDGSSASRSVLERFYLERQILAGLDHPNIARLLDAGTADGKPYLVMDYIEGVPIDEYCDAHRLTVEQRLRLFLPVCDAVQYAHRNLIVHRDLKPGNILITPEGVPKLLDFGIAKLLSADAALTALTRAEGHPMTPGYASPEQLLGLPVTTATDVYSLAVVLYELLTAHKPFGSKTSTIHELYKILQEKREPQRPSVAAVSLERSPDPAAQPRPTPAEISEARGTQPEKLHRALKGDLDTILLRALHTEVECRYSSVDDFAEDIKRHLQGLPVKARPDTLGYRTAKFVRRNPAITLIATAFILTLVVGLCTTTWQAHVARAERARAERRFAEVRNLAHSIIFEIHAAIQPLPGSTQAQKLLVERASTYLDRLAKESAGDTSLKLELASAYQKLGDIQWERYYAHLGDRDGALRSQQKAFEIRKAVAAAHPDNEEAQSGLARSYLLLGDLMVARGEPHNALEYYRHTLSIREQQAREKPDDPARQRGLALAYQRIGDTLGNTGFANLGDFAGAQSNFEKMQQINLRLAAQEPANLQARQNVGIGFEKLARVRGAMGDFAGAQSNFEKMQQINLRLAAREPANLQARQSVGIGFEKLARVRGAMGDWSGALDLFRKEQQAFASTATAQPGNARFERDLPIPYGNIALALFKLGRFTPSLGFCSKEISLREQLAKTDPNDAGAHNDLSEAYRAGSEMALRAGRRQQARQWAEKLLKSETQWAKRAEAKPEDLNALAWDLLTVQVVELRQPSLALSYANRAVQMDGGHDPNLLDTLAQACFQTGDHRRAVDLERKSIFLAASDPVLRKQLETNLAKIQNTPSIHPR